MKAATRLAGKWLRPLAEFEDSQRLMKEHRHYAIFSVRFDPFVGGVESFTADLARELSAQGNRVTVITKRIDDSPERERWEDGIDVVRLPTVSLVNDRLPLSKRNGRHRELLAEVAADGVDRVLVNNRFYPHSLDGLEFARSIGAPAVMLDHGTDYLTMGNAAADAAIRVYEHAITTETKRFAPTYAGISPKSAEWLDQFGITTSLVIPNAIDAEGFRQMSSHRDFRRELGLNEHDVLIAFVGRLTPEKGGDVLARVVSWLDGLQVFCALAGVGTLKESIETQAGSNVFLLGMLDRPDLSALLQSADAFCLPSRSEGFCSALVEASVCGLPSIMPDVGVVRDVMEEPGSGILLEDTTELGVLRGVEEVVLLGSDGRKKMGELARRAAERKFSWRAAVEALEHAFEVAEAGKGSK